MSQEKLVKLSGLVCSKHGAVLYLEKIQEKLIERWTIFDEVTKILITITASGSAVSGWALWNKPEFQIGWQILAGIAALLSLIQSTMGVTGRLKELGDSKSQLTKLRIEIETLRERIDLDPNYDIEPQFWEFKKRLSEYEARQNKFDILKTEKLKKDAATEIEQIKPVPS